VLEQSHIFKVRQVAAREVFEAHPPHAFPLKRGSIAPQPQQVKVFLPHKFRVHKGASIRRQSGAKMRLQRVFGFWYLVGLI